MIPKKATRSLLFFTLILLIMLAPSFFLDGQQHTIHLEQTLLLPRWIQVPYLGTDALGRDLLVQLCIALSTSLWLALSALFVATLLAMIFSISASWLPPKISALLLWIPKALFILPATLLSASLLNITGQHTLTLWLTLLIAPLFILTHFLHLSLASQKNELYWLYSQSTGSQSAYRMMQHQLPYALYHIVPFAVARLPSLIILEGTLSFIGLGLQSPKLSLGLLLQQSIPHIQSYPHLFFVPALTFLFSLFLLQWMSLRLQMSLQRH
ncbi:hypothetical protein [Entomospira culicis]|uniref:ABC transmembrane type-1 domain-containing protein n=1 Tax=Entomospira culicis TaxID=2719989 RepID=A0A968KW71_9SPIO|nr:hypothetical protein [Entomospira culicis]NIZ18657.1 hypothetical protein [Entomospira culicis]NIZ68872.1 hypothetical protein [Entomospira culicis]WDI37465.1 hypothetical protein PVA46_01370 [Entomospira culicis]WDI39093.1 hypothetical protein PVA47_01375 [Entomospira culicis]